MADFRRCIFAFAVVVLLLGLLPTANAQVNGVTCIANAAAPPTLRAEGLTELAGDIVLNCSGGTPNTAGATLPQVNIQVFFNTLVTSRLLGSSNLSEAILTIDEPAPINVAPATTCTSISGCTATARGAAASGTEFKDGINPNVFEGVASGNSVTFIGIPVDPPGTTGNRIFRITNVRVNANAVSAPGANGVPGQVIALVSATPATNGGSTSSVSINNPQVTVAFVSTSLTTSVTTVSTTTGLPTTTAISAAGLSILQCVGRTSSTTVPLSTAVGALNFTEVFQTAFKTHTVVGSGIAAQNVLGLVYNSESGYYNPTGFLGTTLANAGLADFGTRLRAVFNNIPNGISIFVSLNNNPGFSSTANPVSGTSAVLTSTEGATITPVGATSTTFGTGGVWQVPITSGSGEAVWEVIAANPLTIQTYSFSYFAVATAAPSTNSPAVGQGTVNLWYAPTAPQSFAASVGSLPGTAAVPVPRFVDSSVATNVIAVTICRTNLLYPYVTSQAGFDTGLAIANTSSDPFVGTQAQAGPCNLFFYGNNAPASFATPSVATGTVYSTLATTVAPNFTGYVIALCNFQYAHGFAFISDVGARNLAMGYLALVIPDPPNPRQAAPFECGQSGGVAAACDNAGEELGN